MATEAKREERAREKWRERAVKPSDRIAEQWGKEAFGASSEQSGALPAGTRMPRRLKLPKGFRPQPHNAAAL